MIRVHDLAWGRLDYWRAAVAAAFEPGERRSLLSTITEVELRYERQGCKRLSSSPGGSLHGWDGRRAVSSEATARQGTGAPRRRRRGRLRVRGGRVWRWLRWRRPGGLQVRSDPVVVPRSGATSSLRNLFAEALQPQPTFARGYAPAVTAAAAMLDGERDVRLCRRTPRGGRAGRVQADALGHRRSNGIARRRAHRPGRWNDPARTYELLAGETEDWSGVEVWFGDERAVGADDPESNYRMVQETLLAGGSGPDVHRIEGERGPEAAAAGYAELLAERLPSEGGVPVLDLALQGLGPDGHTASLFPGNPAVRRTASAWRSTGRPSPRQTGSR
jgi:hypothetical protein